MEVVVICMLLPLLVRPMRKAHEDLFEYVLRLQTIVTVVRLSVKAFCQGELTVSMREVVGDAHWILMSQLRHGLLGSTFSSHVLYHSNSSHAEERSIG